MSERATLVILLVIAVVVIAALVFIMGREFLGQEPASRDDLQGESAPKKADIPGRPALAATGVLERPAGSPSPDPEVVVPVARVFNRTEWALWARLDPYAAAAWTVNNLGPGGDRSFMLHAAMGRWAYMNPQTALSWALDLTDEQGRECAIRVVIETWASSDPAAAAAGIASIKDFETYSASAGTIGWYWAEVNPDAALRWALKLEGTAQFYALASIALQLYENDPESGIALAEDLPAGHVRNLTVRAIASRMSLEDPEAAAEWVARQIPGGPRSGLNLHNHVSRWARKEPEAAVQWVQSLSEERVKEDAMSTAIQSISRDDPAAASEMLASMDYEETRQGTTARVAFEWAKKDMAAATSWALGLQGDQRAEAITELAVVYDSIDSSGVSGWVSALPTSSDRDTADDAIEDAGDDENAGETPVAELIPEILNSDISVAVVLAEQLPEGDERNGVVHSVAVEWGKEDPEAAIAWAREQLPAGRVADTTTRVILWQWSERDASAASEWALALATGDYRDYSLATVAMALVTEDPSAATALVEAMSEGQRRDNAVTNVVAKWSLTDKAAAEAWQSSLQ